MTLETTHSNCANCREFNLLMRLHGDKGGPFVCLLCKGKWHAEHGRRRNTGHVVIRAIKAFLAAGGRHADLDKLQKAAFGEHLTQLGINLFPDELMDELGYLHGVAKHSDEVIELTSELLTEVLMLTHPDKHPPERQEQATRVTQKLMDLKPFVFPAPKPRPIAVSPGQPRDASVKDRTATFEKLSRRTFPCSECASTVPYFYCDACRTEWNKRQQAKKDRLNAKQREWYKRRQETEDLWKRPRHCPCGTPLAGKRKDARFCSNACKQRRYRNAVTDGTFTAARIDEAVTQ
jgi:hypothetical protein